MMDLIYLGDDEDRAPLVHEIMAEYPNAKIEDASDFIHRNRFSLEIPEVDERQFFRFAVKKGFALCCLNIGIAIRTPESWVKEELELLKKEKGESK